MCLFIGGCVYALWLSVGRTRYTPTRRNLYLCKSYKRVLSWGAYLPGSKLFCTGTRQKKKFLFSRFSLFLAYLLSTLYLWGRTSLPCTHSLSRIFLVHALSLGAYLRQYAEIVTFSVTGKSNQKEFRPSLHCKHA